MVAGAPWNLVRRVDRYRRSLMMKYNTINCNYVHLMYTIERLPPLPSTSMRRRVSEICVIECISVVKSGFVSFIACGLWLAGLCYWCALCMFVWV